MINSDSLSQKVAVAVMGGAVEVETALERGQLDVFRREGDNWGTEKWHSG